MDLAVYRKAFVPLVVAAVLLVLGALHVTGTMSVSDGVTLLVSSLGVYLVPNKPGPPTA